MSGGTKGQDVVQTRRRRPRVVTIIDIGLHSSFDSSTAVIQSSLRSLNLGGDEEAVAVDVVRTRDTQTILTALTAPSAVIHVIAHGDQSDGDPALSSEDGETVVWLKELEDHIEWTGRPVSASALLIDGCKTLTQPWQKSFARCVTSETAYIGTRRSSGWHDALLFGPAFYASLLRNTGRGITKVDHSLDAAQRAVKAFDALTDLESPYGAVRLQSTR